VDNHSLPSASQVGRMADKSPDAKITVERREQIVLIGINRPQMFNRIDPDAFYGLAKAYYDFDNDPTLRAALLFGHGENFSRGNDVEAFSALAKTGHAFKLGNGQIDPLGRAQKLSKPLVVVVHGDTWNMGHELHLVADIRVANADVRYAQTENAHGRVPGVAPVRMVREARAGPTQCATCSPGITGTRRLRNGWGSCRKLRPIKTQLSERQLTSPTGSPPAGHSALRRR
jgi:enoyl-CoA hydratase/carnithine racemase